MLEGEEHLWTFLRIPGIEPTNNAAERALRHAVLWRRSSGGTASEWGSRFVERVLSVAATCRQQGRNLLEYLTGCFQASMEDNPMPPLLANRPTLSQLLPARERLLSWYEAKARIIRGAVRAYIARPLYKLP